MLSTRPPRFRPDGYVKQRMFDPDMVVEPLHMDRTMGCDAGLEMDRGRAVRGQWHFMSFSESSSLHEAGNPHAPRRIGLEYVHRFCREDVAKGPACEGIFPPG